MRKIILFIFAMVAINATTPTYENVTRLYVATFDRTPDVTGLKYWVNDSGLDLEDIARSFFDQPETKAKYYPDGTIYLYNFVEEIYANLFDRAPDSAGQEYWVDFIMEGGFERVSVFILAVINGAQGNDAVILNDKTKYAYDTIKDQLPDEPTGGTTCSSFSDHSNYWTGNEGDRVRWYCTYYYYSNDRLATEKQFTDGVGHGPYRSYYESGNIANSGDYWNGNRVGTWINYYETGGKRCRDYDDGIVIKDWYNCD